MNMRLFRFIPVKFFGQQRNRSSLTRNQLQNLIPEQGI